jgi:phosphoglycolate phosphatase-like HAD superfamily hydrolase
MIKSQLRKFDLSTDQTFYVGDRIEDMEAARNNQLKFIGVSWGYGKFSEHVPIIDFFKQLENFVV